MRILITILLSLAFHFGVCQNDTIVVGVQEHDSLIGDTIECYPYGCKAEKSHVYEVPGPFSGVIDIGGPLGAKCSVMLTTANDSVHFDTCVVLSPFAGNQYRKFLSSAGWFQVHLTGPEGALVDITAKIDTSTARPLLPEPFILLDTLCGTPTWVDFPTELPTLYWRMDTGARAEIPLSPGLHIEQSGDRRRLILVR